MATDSREFIARARDQIDLEMAALATVSTQLDDSFVAVTDLLLTVRGKVFVTGSGTSGHIGRRLAHLLSVCGTPAVYLQPMDALHGTMGAVGADDVVMAISKGGVSDEINDLCRRLRDRGATIVSVTANGQSPLAKLADISVVLTTTPGADPGEMIAMGSTLVVGIWGDALAYTLMQARGYSWDSFRHSHPAGAVGKMPQGGPMGAEHTAPPPASAGEPVDGAGTTAESRSAQ